MFDLILQTLDGINRQPPEAGEVLFWGFQLRFATSFGYAPQFLLCATCDHPLEEGDVRFSPSLGGALCARCFAQDTSAIAISMGTVKLMARIQHLPMDRLARLRPSYRSRHEITRVIGSFFLYHMEGARELKSLKFLKSMDFDQTPVQNTFTK